MPWRALLGKRLVGAANLKLRRSSRFGRAPQKLAALAHFAQSAGVQLVVFTGDSTALGTLSEHVAARAAMRELTEMPMGMLSIPGNHDLYLADSVEGRYFDQHFGDLRGSHIPELGERDGWPIIRLLGDSTAIVAVNSAKPNPQFWRSSGRVPEVQLDALKRALEHRELTRRFVFVASHYGPRGPDGRPDTALHGLENAQDFLVACEGLRRGAIIHGHMHSNFHLRLNTLPAPVFCAGSATYEGREGFWVFDVGDGDARACPGNWSGDQYFLNENRAIRI